MCGAIAVVFGVWCAVRCRSKAVYWLHASFLLAEWAVAEMCTDAWAAARRLSLFVCLPFLGCCWVGSSPSLEEEVLQAPPSALQPACLLVSASAWLHSVGRCGCRLRPCAWVAYVEIFRVASSTPPRTAGQHALRCAAQSTTVLRGCVLLPLYPSVVAFCMTAASVAIVGGLHVPAASLPCCVGCVGLLCQAPAASHRCRCAAWSYASGQCGGVWGDETRPVCTCKAAMVFLINSPAIGRMYSVLCMFGLPLVCVVCMKDVWGCVPLGPQTRGGTETQCQCLNACF